MNQKNVIILGAGTAGCFTALYIKKILPNYNVYLIKNSEIGIVGVGEATTPHFVNALRQVDIDVIDAIKKTNGSIKNGIMFDNWNGDGKKYFHPFSEAIVDWTIPGVFSTNCRDQFVKQCVDKNVDLSQHIYQHYISEKNKIDLNYTTWAIHFDAGLMANYLEESAKQKGVIVLDEKYIDAKQDKKGFITHLVFESGNSLETCFVFDCTGFHRSLIGKFYKQTWISYSKYLPMNKAIPFWIKNENYIEPYTSSIALKNGWMWKIPLQNRIGSGYIFDGNYITVDQAKNEVEEYLGHEIEIRKIIDFSPGRYDNIWVKNCMAVGLSGNFLEPIESTSLWLTISQLELFKYFLNDLEYPNNDSRKKFNKIIGDNVDECMHFVYLHYITKRNDSEFWKKFRKNHPVPASMKEKLRLLTDSSMKWCDTQKSASNLFFSLSSWYIVGHGLGIIKTGKNLDNYNITPNLYEYYNMIKQFEIENSYDHKTFLENIDKASYNN